MRKKDPTILPQKIFNSDLSSDTSKEAIEALCRKERIELFILFGSYAKGSAHPLSDIDVAVQAERGRKLSKLHLICKLVEIFRTDRVDLVLLTPETSPLLLYEIFFHGRPLYESSDGLFDQGKLRAWKLYLDSEKLRKWEREYLKELVRRLKHVT